MKTAPRYFLLLLALPFAAVLPGAPRVASPPMPIAKQIDALLKNRLRPEPLPIDPPNPFVLPNSRRDTPSITPGDAAANASGGARANPNEVARPATAGEILADCAAHLRIGGLMRTKDQVQLVINDLPRKEGDVMTVPWNGTRIQITIAVILPEQVILRYNDARLAVRF